MNATATFTALRSMGIPKPVALRAMTASHESGKPMTIGNLTLWPSDGSCCYTDARWILRTEGKRSWNTQ